MISKIRPFWPFIRRVCHFAQIHPFSGGFGLWCTSLGYFLIRRGNNKEDVKCLTLRGAMGVLSEIILLIRPSALAISVQIEVILRYCQPDLVFRAATGRKL